MGNMLKFNFFLIYQIFILLTDYHKIFEFAFHQIMQF